MVSPESKVTPPSKAKVSLDKISEGSESSRSVTVDSRKRIVNNDDESIKEELTEQIQEEISEAESYTDRSKSSALLKIPSSFKDDKLSPREDISVRSDQSPRDYSYTEDFNTDNVTSHKATSVHTLPNDNTDLQPRPSPRSITENIISEVISERLPSHAEDDESFIKPLENMKNIEYEESDVEPKSPPSTTKSDSRPSSAKSSSSIFDEDESERSEIEKRLRVTSPDKSVYSEEITTDESPMQTARAGESRIPGGVFDIDQLLGLESLPVDDDEETPLASPRDEEPPSTTEDERTEDYQDFIVGDRVQVTGPNGQRQSGTLKFKGRVKFASGIWAGVELESPDGRHDGTYDDGQRYFTCRPNHGVMVPANDLTNAPLPKMSPLRESDDFVRSSMDSVNTSADQDELNQVIRETDAKVRGFDQNGGDKDKLVDDITDDILVDLVEKEKNFVKGKTSPPVAPKPKKQNIVPNNSDVLMNGNANDLEKEIFAQKNNKHVNLTDRLVDSLLDDALTKMITTRNKQRSRGGEVGNNLIDFDNVEPQQKKADMSPSEELLDVMNKPDPSNVPSDVPLRPGSPLPGSKPKVPHQVRLSKGSSLGFLLPC